MNVLPEVNAGGPYAGELGEEVLIDGATARDPSDPTGETFTYAWDLDDDGTFETKERQPAFFSDLPGSFTIHLQVQEKVGEPIIASTIVAIQRSGNLEPVAKDDQAETKLSNRRPRFASARIASLLSAGASLRASAYFFIINIFTPPSRSSSQGIPCSLWLCGPALHHYSTRTYPLGGR